MNLHTAYLCLGSNSDAYGRLEKARELLEAAFRSIIPQADAPFQGISSDADRTFHTVSSKDALFRGTPVGGVTFHHTPEAAFHSISPNDDDTSFRRTTPDVTFRYTVPQADVTFHHLSSDDAPFQCIVPKHPEASPETVFYRISPNDDRAFRPLTFSTPTETEAVGEGWLSPFVNQVARLYTPLSADEIRAICKEIERKCGRTEGEKACGRMSMDVDLLTFDDAVLKPKDMQREYILQGISELQ